MNVCVVITSAMIMLLKDFKLYRIIPSILTDNLLVNICV
jgi:hypothetical protein